MKSDNRQFVSELMRKLPGNPKDCKDRENMLIRTICLEYGNEKPYKEIPFDLNSSITSAISSSKFCEIGICSKARFSLIRPIMSSYSSISTASPSASFGSTTHCLDLLYRNVLGS